MIGPENSTRFSSTMAMTNASDIRLNALYRRRLRRALTAEDTVQPRARTVALSAFATLFVGTAGFAWHGAHEERLAHRDIDRIEWSRWDTDATAIPTIEREEEVLGDGHADGRRVVARDLDGGPVEEPYPWWRHSSALGRVEEV